MSSSAINSSEIQKGEFENEEMDLETFQKQAIWCKMREYKQLANQSQEELEIISKRAKDETKKTELIYNAWSNLCFSILTELKMYSVNGSDGLCLLEEVTYSNLFSQNDLSNTEERLETIKCKLIEEGLTVTNLLQKFLQSQQTLLTNLRNSEGELVQKEFLFQYYETQSVDLEFKNESSTKTQKITKKCKDLHEELSQLDFHLQIKTQENQALSTKIEQLQQKILKQEKILAKTLIKGYAKNDKRMRQSPEENTEGPEVSGAEHPQASNENSGLSYMEKNKLQEENKRLQNENDELKTTLMKVPDYIIMNTVEYRSISCEYDYLLRENELLIETLENQKLIIKDRDEEIFTIKKNLKTKSSEKIKELTKNIHELQTDITRIRKDRDKLQIKLNNKHELEGISNNESFDFKSLYEMQKKRISSLVSEVERLRQNNNSTTSPNITDNYSNNDLVNIDNFRVKINNMDCYLKDLKSDVESVRSLLAHNTDNDNLEVSTIVKNTPISQNINVRHLQKENSQLKNQLDFFANLFKKTDSQSNINNEIVDALKERIEQQRKEIAKLEDKNELLLKSEAKLTLQTENNEDSWLKLNHLNSYHEKKILEKDQEINKLILEKTKREQKYMACARQLNRIELLVNENKSLLDKKEKHNKHSDLRIQNLLYQIENSNEIIRKHEYDITKFKDIINLKSKEIESSKIKISNLERNQIELQTEIKNMNSIVQSYSEVQKDSFNECPIKEKLESEALEESKEKEYISTISELENKCDDYRRLLTCPSCDLRFKSHSIIRCMHVFCKDCINSRINNRRRKCPTCNESFGLNDVKQIYL